jgi:hypothetical protein
VLLTLTLALLQRLFQLLLVSAKQDMDLAMRCVADSVNLRTELLARCGRILIEDRLNPVVVLLEQGPDLPLLFRSQLEILCQTSELLVDRLRRVDVLKLLTC